MNFLSNINDILSAEERKNAILAIFISLLSAFSSLVLIYVVVKLFECFGEDAKCQNIFSVYVFEGNPTRSEMISFLCYFGLSTVPLNFLIQFWRLAFVSKYVQNLSVNLGNKILDISINNCSVFTQFSNDEIFNLSVIESQQFATQFVRPILEGVSALLTISFLSIFLVLSYFEATVFSIIFISLIYLMIYLVVRQILYNAGEERISSSEARLKIIENTIMARSEIVTGDKFISALGQLKKQNAIYAKSHVTSNVLSQFPLVAMQSIIFLVLIVFISIAVSNSDKISFDNAIIVAFGLSAMRILPEAQKLYKSAAQLKYGSKAFSVIHKLIVEPFRGPIFKANYSQTSVVNIDNVSFSFNANGKLINNISFEINLGDRIYLSGPSGSGKSTFLNLILGLIAPTSGAITFGVQYKDCKYADMFAYIPQKIFYEGESLKEIVDNYINGSVSNNEERTEDLKFVNALINALGLRDLYDDRGDKSFSLTRGEVSGGQAQRISILRALLGRQKILVLDESTSALDDYMSKCIMEVIFSSDRFDAIIYVSHQAVFKKYANKEIQFQ